MEKNNSTTTDGLDVSEALASLPKDNPFSNKWDTPFGVPPFDAIKPEHFAPAFAAGMAQHNDNIAAIKKNTPVTFANTVDALELAGRGLTRVSRVFFNLTAAHTNKALQEVEREMSPQLAAHSSKIFLDQEIFSRLKHLMQDLEMLDLTREQERMLDRYHAWFVRAGADLEDAARERVSEIQSRLATLATKFNQNVLADEQSWHMTLESEEDLDGLPQMLRDAAAQAAADHGLDGKHVITLARSSVEGFLKHSARRDLRQEAFEAWSKRGAKTGDTDNRLILKEMVTLRRELATLMGFENYAAYALQNSMAKTPEAVNTLLQKVWKPALAKASDERKALSELASSEGDNHEIQAWDWRFYAEKLRQKDYDLDEAEVRAYFSLDTVVDAAFETANRLFGLSFKKIDDVSAYHQDCRVYDVTDREGAHVAVFVADYFARSSKRSGAWMSSFRSQSKLQGDVRPIIVNVLNFSAAGSGQETLISFDDAETLFHEFGHGLHGMLSNVTYPSLAGTSVTSDFVELPSQLYEHWLRHPEALKKYARHFKTGEAIPDTLLSRLQAVQNFNQGFDTVEYTASALVDMALHTADAQKTIDDIEAFEKGVLEEIGMPDEIIMRHRLPHFMHITGGYAAGYYSYLWSEVMDADAFQAFEEAGDIYDSKTAERLKDFIYSAGNRQDPEQAYVDFRGRAPQIAALMKKRGFEAEAEKVGQS